MRYKAKNLAALQLVLGDLPDGELRRVTTWSEYLVITTPQIRDPESAAVENASRQSPRGGIKG
jgi:hypothetical protein